MHYLPKITLQLLVHSVFAEKRQSWHYIKDSDSIYSFILKKKRSGRWYDTIPRPFRRALDELYSQLTNVTKHSTLSSLLLKGESSNIFYFYRKIQFGAGESIKNFYMGSGLGGSFFRVTGYDLRWPHKPKP